MTALTDSELRRDFDLPEDDLEALNARGLQWEALTTHENGARAHWVLFHEYPIHPGYVDRAAPGTAVASALVAVRVTGYPGGALDMVYVHPPLARADGHQLRNLSDLAIAGRTFQQWSRHYTSANPFRVGVDSLATHLLLVDEWFSREFR